MRVAIETHNLFEGVQRVQNVVDKKKTQFRSCRIFCWKLTSENTTIKLVATNLEVGMSTILPASEVTEGSITYPSSENL